MPTTTSSADFEHMFELAPVSLWLEDYSGLKQNGTYFSDLLTEMPVSS